LTGHDESSRHVAGLRVLVVDDHVFLAEMLALEIAQHGCTAWAIGAPATLADVLDAADQMHPDVVLLDYSLGDRVGPSLGLIAPLRALGAAVVMLTGITDELQWAACLEAGAAGVLAKSVVLPQIVDAIARAARGDAIQSITEREALLERFRSARRAARARAERFEQLTRREREVLAALMDGRSASEIADDFVVSIVTVRTQIQAILRKLDVSSQLAAVGLAHRCGWSGATMRTLTADASATATDHVP
jgi:DNA-binding NarL/FixJ family response regulator